jgi:hypothetical protein
MPTILRIEGFRFFFYSSDIAEPSHVHVEKDDKTAKVWLDPVRLQNSHGYLSSEVNRIVKIVIDNQDDLIRSWNEYFKK